jgi:hypothetical protein
MEITSSIHCIGGCGWSGCYGEGKNLLPLSWIESCSGADIRTPWMRNLDQCKSRHWWTFLETCMSQETIKIGNLFITTVLSHISRFITVWDLKNIYHSRDFLQLSFTPQHLPSSIHILFSLVGKTWNIFELSFLNVLLHNVSHSLQNLQYTKALPILYAFYWTTYITDWCHTSEIWNMLLKRGNENGIFLTNFNWPIDKFSWPQHIAQF